MRTYEYAVEIYGKDNWNFLRQIDVFSDKDVAIEIGKRIKTADDEEVHITTIEREDNEEQVDCSSERLNDSIKELDMENKREEGIDYKTLWNKAFEWIAENAFPEDYDNFVDRLNLTPEEKRELGIEEEM